MNSKAVDFPVPGVHELREVADRLRPYIVRTPTISWPVPKAGGGPQAELMVKLELLQRTGSFKVRGALNTVLDQLPEDIESFPGITAFSAGNHAIATAFAACTLGVSAKVVMPRTANPYRIERCQAYGAEIVFGDTISDLLQLTDRITIDEGRLLIHPFEGVGIVSGTATVGLELCDDISALDAVIVPVGGGGLIAGIATAVKQLQPACKVIGVEPVGASGMQQSVAQRAPMSKVEVNTIADSLGAPMHAPLSFELVQRYVDQIVSVSDDEMRMSMRQMFLDLKLAVEPACAAALAAFNGPLAASLAGKRVALIACGSNIDFSSYQELLAR